MNTLLLISFKFLFQRLIPTFQNTAHGWTTVNDHRGSAGHPMAVAGCPCTRCGWLVPAPIDSLDPKAQILLLPVGEFTDTDFFGLLRRCPRSRFRVFQVFA